MKFADVTGIYRCDSCKKTFDASEVKLSEPIGNIELLTLPSPFVYVDKNGVCTTGSAQPTAEREDKLLTCPHCDAIHLFGMDRIK